MDAGAALELPTGAAESFSVSSPYPDAPAPVAALRAGLPVVVSLRPFEVLVLECLP